MKKKIMFLAVLAFALFVPSVYADVVEVGDAESFKSEIAKDNAEVKLTTGIQLDEIVDINNNVTIDLGGNTITGTAARVFNIRKGNVVIKNGTIKDTNSSSNAAIIYIYGHESSGADKTNVTLAQDLKIEGISGVVVSNNGGNNYGITVDIQADITNNVVQDSDVIGFALSIHGKIKEGDIKVSVTGNLTGIDTGIFQAGLATVSLDEGAVVTGKSGAIVKSGTLKVNKNAKVSGTGTVVEASPSGNGAIATGAGIQVESNKSYAGQVNIDIEGGAVESTNNSAIQEYLATDDDETSVESIKVGGNATLKAADNKDVVDASEKFDAKNEKFIAEGTVLTGKTDDVIKYLGAGLEVGKDGKVIDPDDEVESEPVPPTGDNVLTYVSLGAVALIGTMVTSVYLRKVNN